MSIVPGNVAAVSESRYTDQNTVDLNAKKWQNTYSTAVVIGEKAALIIAQDLGIPMDEGNVSLVGSLSFKL